MEQLWLAVALAELILIHLQEVDQASAADAFGFPTISLEATVAETVTWLHSAGYLSDEQAGNLAG